MFSNKLYATLQYAERGFLIILGIGLLMPYLNLNGNSFKLIALSGLSTLFFLYAFAPQDAPGEEAVQYQVAMRAGWLSNSISSVGLLFFFMHWPGAVEMCTVGGIGTIIALIIIMITHAAKGDKISFSHPLIWRGVPLLLMDFIILSTLL